ncbi:hypothetical protein [Rufibacter sp. LB8]|uniref:hypothetical protein n=1 Tax=Rufibacter sp. LB8 TaxID=2777781 RepID=UPI00178C333E|nr:hypothetical protein [Rufibacter sp. LB8]
MNKHIKDSICNIDQKALEEASRNNFKLMYADDNGYEVKQGDALYIIIDCKLHRLEMDSLKLIGWKETEGFSVEEMSSVNFYLNELTNRLLLCEMCYQTGYCIAYYSNRKPIEVPVLINGHKQHYLDMALIRKLKIDGVLN